MPGKKTPTDIVYELHTSGKAISMLDLWRSAVESAPDLIFFHDQQLNIVWANRAYLTASGQKLENIINKPYWDCFPLSDGPLPGCIEAMDTHSAEEKEIQLEDNRWFRSYSFPLYDEQNNYMASVHVLRDISRFKELKSEHELSHFANEHTVDAIYLINESSAFYYVNQAAIDMLGYTREELLQFHVADIDPVYSNELWRQQLHEMVARGNITIESQHKRKDGSCFPVRITANYHKHNGTGFIIAIARDITRIKEYEQKLIENEQRYRDLFENMTSGVSVREVIVDELGKPVNYRFVEVNKAYENITGFNRDDILGRTILDVIPDIEPYWINILGQVAITGESTEYNRYVPQFDKYLAVHAFSPEPGKVACVMEDISELVITNKQLERKTTAFKTLSAVNHLLVHSTSEEELLDKVCKTIAKESVYPLAWIGSYQEDGTIKIVSNSETANAFLEQIDLSGNDETKSLPLFKALQHKNTYAVHDILNDADCKICHHIGPDHGLFCVVSIPFKCDQDHYAVLNVYGSSPFSITAEEILLLEELAKDIEYGLASIRTYKMKELLSKNLDKTLVATIQAISTALEKRDPYTAGHQRRVAQLATAIGHELQLSRAQIEGLHLGGMIHDIGKIYVPAEILSYPGKISSELFSIIKTHPNVGFDIVKNIDFPWPIADMVHQHHERYDGSGYPDGIKGEDITFEARILSVADVVEAMASHRPYRPGLGISTALDEIKSGSGKLYDPRVTEACVRVFEKNGFKFDEDAFNN